MKSKLLRLKKDGKRILSIQERYEEVVAPTDSKYSRYSFNKSNTVVCPYHSDNDPSFGLVYGNDGIERFHCFGCQTVGDYLDFYVDTERIFRKRFITEETAIKELVEKYNIPIEDLEINIEEKVKTRDEQMRDMVNQYQLYDYESDIRRGILLRKDLSYYNLCLLKYISSKKGI